MRKLLYILFVICLLGSPCVATTFFVNGTGGSDSNTCTQAQSTSTPKATPASAVGCMTGGDTVTIFAGTYTSVTVPAGTGSGVYNTVNNHATDVVTFTGSATLNSHTILSGFVFNHTGSCISINSSATDIYIRNNSLTQCGTLGIAVGNSFIYIQNNVFAYSGCTAFQITGFAGTSGTLSFTNTGNNGYAASNTVALNLFSGTNTGLNNQQVTVSATGLSATTFQATVTGTGYSSGTGTTMKAQTCGRTINQFGNHVLIENNDFSHYQLGVVYGGNTGTVTNTIIRNNTYHDQFESEAGSNGHSDGIFAEPQIPTSNTLIEGNVETNAVGPNAKGFLNQNDVCSPSTGCQQLIIRFNVINRNGSGSITDDKSWPAVNTYNNTFVDEGQESPFQAPGGGGDNMLSTGSGQYTNNNVWYEGTSAFTGWNPVSCNGCVTFGHSLAFCVNGCTIFNHIYTGSGTTNFTTDTGNIIADPKFVNYIGVGNASNNFHLQSTSPARNAGACLTTVAAGDSGTGTSLIVNNASPFQDGYGLQNNFTTVQGDGVKITAWANSPLVITAVNYSTSTLTLPSSVSRSSGDCVWLASTSNGTNVATDTTGPDMGAFPFINNGTANAPTFSLPAGTYTGVQWVTLSTTSVGAVICYNTVGSPATNGVSGCTIGTLYTGPVLIPSSETLFAIAGGTGYVDSSVASASYTIGPVAAPSNLVAKVNAQ